MRAAAFLFLLLGGCATLSPDAAPFSEAGMAFDAAGECGSYATGLADPVAGRPLTPDDPVRVASVSKLVVAVGVLKLVEQGKLDLDSDVSQWLGWRLHNPAFPDAPITLRQLLSHTSSVRDGDDIYVIPLGKTLRGTMTDPTAWDSAHAPGSNYFAYANLNFPIVASIIESVTQERFDGVIRRDVLDPLRIDACFNWPACSDEAIRRAVVLTQDGKPIRDDLGGRRPDCPVVAGDRGCRLRELWRPGENGALFSPQGGLRISARGLARIGRMLLNGGTIDGVRILSPQSVDLLLAPSWRFDGRNGARGGESATICSYGLATQQLGTPVRGCDDDPIRDSGAWVGHAGDAYGLRSGLWIDRARGIGVAYFITGLADDLPRGKSAFSAVEEAAFGRTMTLLTERH